MLVHNCARGGGFLLFTTVAIYTAVSLAYVVHPPAKEVLLADKPRILQQQQQHDVEHPGSPQLVTPAPCIHSANSHTRLKRDKTMCPGYSIVGNADPLSDLWCDSGFTCVSGGYGGPTSYFTCGVAGDTYTWITTCYDYPASCTCADGAATGCSCDGERDCPSTAPYCQPWIITDTQTYYQFQCADTPSERVNIVKVTTASIPPSASSSSPIPIGILTSSSPSPSPAPASTPPSTPPSISSPTPSSTPSSASVPASSSAPVSILNSTPSPAPVSTFVSTPSSVLVSTPDSTTISTPISSASLNSSPGPSPSSSPTPSPSPTPEPNSTSSSNPTGINLAAVIAGTLGGVGSFATAVVAIMKYMKKRKETSGS